MRARVAGILSALLGLNLFVLTCWYGNSVDRPDAGQSLLLVNGASFGLGLMALGLYLAATS